MRKTRTPAPAQRRPARHAPASAVSVLRWSRAVHWALVGAVAVAGTAVAFEYGAGRGSGAVPPPGPAKVALEAPDAPSTSLAPYPVIARASVALPELGSTSAPAASDLRAEG